MTDAPERAARRHLHRTLTRQDRYTLRRRLLRDYLLRPVGFRLLVRPTIEGIEHFPAAGSTLVIMNHIAAIDPFVVVGAVTSRAVVPMSKIENYRNPLIALIAWAWGVFPVRRGEVDRQALDTTVALLEQDCPVLIAPEGTRQSALSEARDGTAYVATRANAIVAPVAVDGTDGFPATLKRLRPTPISLRFGRAFRFRTGGRARVPRAELRQMTREMMYQLASLLPEQRRGFYRDLDQATTDYLEFLD